MDSVLEIFVENPRLHEIGFILTNLAFIEV